MEEANLHIHQRIFESEDLLSLFLAVWPCSTERIPIIISASANE